MFLWCCLSFKTDNYKLPVKFTTLSPPQGENVPLVVKREGCCQFNLTIEAKHRGVLVRADSPGETFYSWLIFHHCKIVYFLPHLHHYHPQETGRTLDLIFSKRILALHTILGKGAQQLIICLIESTN